MVSNNNFQSLFRSFLLKHIFFTDGIGYLFIIPSIAYIYVISTPLEPEQQYGFIITAIIVCSIYIVIIIMSYWYLHKPFAQFCKKMDNNEVIEDSLKIAVRERFSSFSCLHTLSITLRWLTGFLLISVCVNLISGITFDQLLNLWIAAAIVSAYSFIEYDYVSKKLVKNFSQNEKFRDLYSVISNKTTTFMGSITKQIASDSIMILIILALILTVTAIAVAQNSLNSLYNEIVVNSTGSKEILLVSRTKNLAMWMTCIGVFWLVIAMFVMYRNYKEWLDPITIFRDRIVSFAQGNFAKEQYQYIGGNEIGMLGSSTKVLSDKIYDVVQVIVNLSSELAASSEEMSGASNHFSENAQNEAANVEQITASMEEMSSTISNVAHNTEDLFKSLMSLIDSMQILSEYITNMSKLVTDTFKVAQEIALDAKSGDNSLMNMNETMKIITKSSADMIGIVNIIDDISDQINLLSLNASIEAARAGDAGRGFAVVAEEISKLADQTATSIKNITSLITLNNKEISNGMKEILGTSDILQRIIKGVNTIENGIEKINDTMNSQMHTNSTVQESVSLLKIKSEDIKMATGEQKIAVYEISQSMTSINQLTTTYASGAEEIAGTSESVAQMANSLKEVVEFFKV